MTTTLVILAHPEPASFNGAWARATMDAARAAGDTVLLSDLCAMGFDPVERATHYADPPDPFDPLKAQEAAAQDGLPADVADEVEKLRAADRIVVHFPLWWFAPPAVLKGWCERVMVHGLLHDVARRFDTGLFPDSSVLFCVTTGSDDAESAPDGREGDSRLLLWPLAATFRYLGMQVLEPVFAHGVHGYHKGAAKAALETRLAGVLDRQGAVLAGWSDHPRWRFHADDDFDDEGRLKPGVEGIDPFITTRAG